MQSGRSRGFGFVYYEAPEDAREVGCTVFLLSYCMSNFCCWVRLASYFCPDISTSSYLFVCSSQAPQLRNSAIGEFGKDKLEFATLCFDRWLERLYLSVLLRRAVGLYPCDLFSFFRQNSPPMV